MTHVIRAKNVNHALPEGLWWLRTVGQVSDSRNGRVVVAPEPVVTEYLAPNERVLFSALRDANPFFHLMESLWMLAGRNDVAFPAHYAANLVAFSDDGKALHGAYGYRWRHAMGHDQLLTIIEELKKNPDSRRCVLQMWDATNGVCGAHQWGLQDLDMAVSGGKDVPCNTQAYFDTLGGKLNMTVTNRSNDVVWGCYGANVVHFSVLHEYVAACAELPMGVYRQFSNNYHMYIDRPDVQRLYNENGVLVVVEDYYEERGLKAFPLIRNQVDWHADMEYFFDAWVAGKYMTYSAFKEDFWLHVVVPIVNCHVAYKRGDFSAAFANLELCAADDWKLACHQWIDRRKEKRNV